MPNPYFLTLLPERVEVETDKVRVIDEPLVYLERSAASGVKIFHVLDPAAEGGVLARRKRKSRAVPCVGEHAINAVKFQWINQKIEVARAAGKSVLMQLDRERETFQGKNADARFCESVHEPRELCGLREVSRRSQLCLTAQFNGEVGWYLRPSLQPRKQQRRKAVAPRTGGNRGPVKRRVRKRPRIGRVARAAQRRAEEVELRRLLHGLCLLRGRQVNDSRCPRAPSRGKPNTTKRYTPRSPAAERECRAGEMPASGGPRLRPTG